MLISPNSRQSCNKVWNQKYKADFLVDLSENFMGVFKVLVMGPLHFHFPIQELPNSHQL